MNQAMREKILGADDLKRFPFPAPEWDLPEGLFIRVLTANERDGFEDSIMARNGKVDIKGVRARLAVLCLTGEDGKRLFNDKDAGELGAKSGIVLDRAFDQAQVVNAMTDADVETLAGNSPAGPSATL